MIIIDSIDSIGYGALLKKRLKLSQYQTIKEMTQGELFHPDMSNKSAAIVTKYMGILLLLVYAFGQLECFLPNGI